MDHDAKVCDVQGPGSDPVLWNQEDDSGVSMGPPSFCCYHFWVQPAGWQGSNRPVRGGVEVLTRSPAGGGLIPPSASSSSPGLRKQGKEGHGVLLPVGASSVRTQPASRPAGSEHPGLARCPTAPASHYPCSPGFPLMPGGQFSSWESCPSGGDCFCCLVLVGWRTAALGGLSLRKGTCHTGMSRASGKQRPLLRKGGVFPLVG